MSNSKTEEIIAGVWFCAAFLAFIAGFNVAGFLFSFKAGMDVICVIY